MSSRRLQNERAHKLFPARLYEVLYRIDEKPESQTIRVVASNPLWPYTEIFKRKYKGSNKTMISVSDQGPVEIGGPRQKLEQQILSRIDLLKSVLYAIEKDIADLEFSETILQTQRQRLAELKERVEANS
jgi:hypothetical protein